MIRILKRLHLQIIYRNAWAYNELWRFRNENEKFSWGGGYGHSISEEFVVIFLIWEDGKCSSPTRDMCYKINRDYIIRNYKPLRDDLKAKFDRGDHIKFVEFWVSPKGYFCPIEYAGKENWISHPRSFKLYDPFIQPNI